MKLSLEMPPRNLTPNRMPNPKIQNGTNIPDSQLLLEIKNGIANTLIIIIIKYLYILFIQI